MTCQLFVIPAVGRLLLELLYIYTCEQLGCSHSSGEGHVGVQHSSLGYSSSSAVLLWRCSRLRGYLNHGGCWKMSTCAIQQSLG